MHHRSHFSSLVNVALVAAAAGGLLAWLARDRVHTRASDASEPDREDMERLLQKFAAALPRDEAEWMLRRGQNQLRDWE